MATSEYEQKVYFLNTDATLKSAFKSPFGITKLTVMKDGAVLALSILNQLFIINPNGTLRAEFNNLMFASEPTILSDETIIIGTLDKKVHFLKYKESLLIRSVAKR